MRQSGEGKSPVACISRAHAHVREGQAQLSRLSSMHFIATFKFCKHDEVDPIIWLVNSRLECE